MILEYVTFEVTKICYSGATEMFEQFYSAESQMKRI